MSHGNPRSCAFAACSGVVPGNNADMAVFRRGSALLASLLALLPLMIAPPAHAQQPGMCRVVDVDFTAGGIAATAMNPELDLQIVAWLEKPSGEFVDTIYITQQTGRYGIGNRPGRFDFNAGPNWPYGRRVTVFPVWANRHGLHFPQIAFRNGDDSNLSHPADQSSREIHFCRPLQKTDVQWDTATCASAVFTDKGLFSSDMTIPLSGYPPRADVIPTAGMDSPSVEMYKTMNQFDAVSQATPRLGAAAEISWPIPTDLPTGDYVLFMEVALEQDFNGTYNPTRFKPPTNPEIPWSDYGVAYRGQPSVIYRVPFTISNTETIATGGDTYVGYGDPGPASDPGTGRTPVYYAPDGRIRPPDTTITTGVPGTGAERLQMTSRDGQTFRIRVDARPEPDYIPPAAPGVMAVDEAQASDVTLTFVAPGDDDMIGRVKGYDVRYLVGDTPIDDASFALANEAKFAGTIVSAGELQTITLHDLLPETQYSFAVRAFDDCHNTSTITRATFTTAPRKIGQVDACFVATAAYGSLLANDVEMLRRFRDRMLKRSVLGELAVETYYTFGPALAGVIGESDLLRSTARDALAPVVRWVRVVH